jgi:hypothetical protein
MVFVINEDIIHKIGENCNPKIITGLQNLATSRRYGKNIIYANIKTLKFLMNLECLDRTSKDLYKSLYNNFIKINGLLKIVDSYVNLVTDDNTNSYISNDGKVILNLSISFLDDFDLVSAPVILSENSTDIDIFGKVAELYMYKHKIKGLCLNYKIRGANGSQIYREYKNILMEQTTFCLCLADTDKKYEGCNIGNTLRLLEHTDKSYKHKYVGQYNTPSIFSHPSTS